MTMMTQCRMKRASDGATHTAWIESKFAVLRKVVDIKIDGVMDRGWTVFEVGSTRDSRLVYARERDFKAHRKATDV